MQYMLLIIGDESRMNQLEAADLDAAIDWARRCPAAQHGTIEVRPIWPTRASA